MAQVIVGAVGVSVIVTVVGSLVVVTAGPFSEELIGGAGPSSWTSYWNVSVPVKPGFGV